MKNTKLPQITLLIALFGFCISPTFAQKNKKDKNNPWTSLAPTKVKEWDGVYLGSVPCADCEGIKTMIRLTKENKFVINKVIAIMIIIFFIINPFLFFNLGKMIRKNG